MIEDRDNLLNTIANAVDPDSKREELLGKTTVVDRTPDTAPAAGPASIVVLSNADDKVVSTGCGRSF